MTIDVKDNIQRWKVADMRPNPWNPNVQSDFVFEREKGSILKLGFIDPVTIREIEEDGKVVGQILDGEHRWKAATTLMMEEIPVNNLGQLSDAKAKAVTDLLNSLHGEPDPIKQAELVTAVLDELPEFSQVLPYTDAEVKDFGDMLGFDWNAVAHDPNPVTPDNPTKTLTFHVPEGDVETVKDAISKALGDGASDKGEALVYLARTFLS